MNAQTALVTGAATGIGKALVKKLDREGWRCFAGYNRQPPDALLAACSDRTRAVQCDVTDSDGLLALAAEVGPIDLLVNNAGLGRMDGPLASGPLSDITRTIDTGTREPQSSWQRSPWER